MLLVLNFSVFRDHFGGPTMQNVRGRVWCALIKGFCVVFVVLNEIVVGFLLFCLV